MDDMQIVGNHLGTRKLSKDDIDCLIKKLNLKVDSIVYEYEPDPHLYGYNHCFTCKLSSKNKIDNIINPDTINFYKTMNQDPTIEEILEYYIGADGFEKFSYNQWCDKYNLDPDNEDNKYIYDYNFITQHGIRTMMYGQCPQYPRLRRIED